MQRARKQSCAVAVGALVFYCILGAAQAQNADETETRGEWRVSGELTGWLGVPSGVGIGATLEYYVAPFIAVGAGASYHFGPFLEGHFHLGHAYGRIRLIWAGRRTEVFVLAQGGALILPDQDGFGAHFGAVVGPGVGNWWGNFGFHVGVGAFYAPAEVIAVNLWGAGSYRF